MAEQEFLDYEGVEYLWNQIDSRLDADEEFWTNTRLGSVRGFDTATDMANAIGIPSGAIVRTSGENVAGDGGAAWYKINTVQPAVGETGAIALQNNKYAHRITNVLSRSEGGTGVGGIQEAQVTINNSVVSTVGNAPCWHNGVVCTITIIDMVLKVDLQTGQSHDIVVGTIPAGWRPLNNIYAAAGFVNGSETGIFFRLTSDGNIRVSNRFGSTIPAGKSLTMTMTYVI